jgi:hypothetical protein
VAVLLHIVQGLFALMAFGLFCGFASAKHVGLLLAGLAYGGAAAASLYLTAWWPLVVGFVLAWILRMVGLDPSPGD